MTPNPRERHPLKYCETAEFQRDFKRLAKRFRTLPNDFVLLKKAAIELLHERGIDNGACVKIEHFCTGELDSYKIRKFSCQSLKGKGARSGLRVVYIFERTSRTVHFVEIYFHEKETSNFDEKRLTNWLKNLGGAK